MAKKKQSKTDAIRAALKQNDSPSEVAKLLQKQGVKVSAQYVSTIKTADKKRAERGGVTRKPGRPKSNGTAAAASNGSVDELQRASDLLGQAVELVIAAGEKEAKQLITTAAKLVARIQ